MKKMNILGFLAVAAFSAAPALALNLEGPDLDFFYQQTTASPCVIGGSNCQNPGTFAFNNAGTGGAGSIFDEMSPIYEVAAINSIVPDLTDITIGVDFNEQGSKPQDLYFFKVFVCAGVACNPTTLLTEFNPDTGAPGNEDNEFMTVAVANNGVGWSDYLLTGLDLTGQTRVKFQAKWFNNDGADRFFLVGCLEDDESCGSDIPPVPEPSTMLLMGGSLLGLAYWRRRKDS